MTLRRGYERSLRDTTMETTNWLLVAIIVVLVVIASLIGLR